MVTMFTELSDESLYLTPVPIRISVELAIRIIEDYAHVEGDNLEDAVISSAVSGYGHSTDGHFDDSTAIVEVRYLARDRQVWFKAIYGINGNRVDLWMN